ncbi:TnsA endonuclease N-terminal domain-containing protein [Alteromonas ponticola]|uniref:TnsA endonuclease N-terminal domain-containing protein n=1 Tax=Alteromonas aquimaris TaxID=2998417 RepID=A0ABT3P2Z8_9ALTE|nr:TnsA endonuclease N-terminal domain-containing protein [Alteromonas aquimaris]MCW8107128.1 TnsA endonuclease N-terminal domain-containing protein [Alteromonas aquimaris]
MAAIPKSRVRNPMDKLELREVDRKRYEEWAANSESNDLYRSFVRVGSTMSLGRKHRFWCDKQQRIVELMSDGELRAYKYLIWQPNVVSIKEQYALNPVTTFNIAKRRKVMHPYSYKQRVHHIMSTDFLVTSVNEDGVCVQHAYPYKISEPSRPSRTAQKLDIEAEFWALRNVPSTLLTDNQISKEWFLTLLFCELHYDNQLQFSHLSDFSHKLLGLYQQNPWLSLRDLLKKAAASMKTHYFDAERLFKNAVLQGLLPLSQQKRVRLNEALLLG